MTTMAEQKLTLAGEFMESCNCDYLCPRIDTDSKGAVSPTSALRRRSPASTGAALARGRWMD
jgi:hypothetical protein